MNHARSPFRRAKANLRVAATATDTEIMLYDEIGFWGIRADDFRHALDSVSTPTITLRVNSPGGEVFDALAIYNALREHPAKVTTQVDGVAASMASVIALAGDTVRMADNSFLMIHDPWSFVIGNASEMRKEADVLEKIGGSLVSAYVEKSGHSSEEVAALMADETWFTAAEAQAFGLADEVTSSADEEDAPDSIAALFDLSIFANVPAALRESGDGHDPTVRELERALRDAGLSQIAAKQYVSAGRAAASQRDAEEVEERDVPMAPQRVYLIPGL